MRRPFYLRELERKNFRPAAGGWVFTLSGVAEAKWAYAINDRAKAEVLSRLGWCHLLWRVVVPSALLLFGASVWKNYDDIAASSRMIGMDTVAVIGIVFALLVYILVGHIIPTVQWLVVRPVLQGIAPTKVDASRGSLWARQLAWIDNAARQCSAPYLALICLGGACFVFVSLDKADIAHNGYLSVVGPLLGAVFGVWLATAYGAALYARLNARRTPQ